jgi:hypothetical protein
MPPWIGILGRGKCGDSVKNLVNECILIPAVVNTPADAKTLL